MNTTNACDMYRFNVLLTRFNVLISSENIAKTRTPPGPYVISRTSLFRNISSIPLRFPHSVTSRTGAGIARMRNFAILRPSRSKGNGHEPLDSAVVSSPPGRSIGTNYENDKRNPSRLSGRVSKNRYTKNPENAIPVPDMFRGRIVQAFGRGNNRTNGNRSDAIQDGFSRYVRVDD